MFGKRSSWTRTIAYVGALGALTFAGGTAAHAMSAPPVLPQTVTADTGSCNGSGSAAVRDSHPGLHKGFSTTTVIDGSGATTSCTSNTAINLVSGAGSSDLTGTCIQAGGTASADHVKSFDASGHLLGQSSGTASISLVATDDNGIKVVVSSGSITSGFMSGAIFAGVALSAPGANANCILNNGVLTSGSGDGSGTASN